MPDLRPRRLLPHAALALGAWVVLTGIGHTVGSLWVNVPKGAPYDFRYASLMTLGLSLVFAGALQVGASRGLRAGARWARLLSAGSALYVVGLVLLLMPIVPALGLLALHVAYLALLAAAWRGRGAPAPPAASGAPREA